MVINYLKVINDLSLINAEFDVVKIPKSHLNLLYV